MGEPRRRRKPRLSRAKASEDQGATQAVGANIWCAVLACEAFDARSQVGSFPSAYGGAAVALVVLLHGLYPQQAASAATVWKLYCIHPNFLQGGQHLGLPLGSIEQWHIDTHTFARNLLHPHARRGMRKDLEALLALRSIPTVSTAVE
jgi:hypothetical protein